METHAPPSKLQLLSPAGDEVFQTKQPRGSFYVFADKVHLQLHSFCSTFTLEGQHHLLQICC